MPAGCQATPCVLQNHFLTTPSSSTTCFSRNLLLLACLLCPLSCSRLFSARFIPSHPTLCLPLQCPPLADPPREGTQVDAALGRFCRIVLDQPGIRENVSVLKLRDVAVLYGMAQTNNYNCQRKFRRGTPSCRHSHWR